jgi:hypothetical protein
MKRKRHRPKRRSHKRRKTARRPRARRAKKKKLLTRRQRQKLAFEKREAKYAGLTHRQYIRRRAERERERRKRLDSMTGEEKLRSMIKSGQIFGADDDLLAAAGLTSEQGREHENAVMRRNTAEVKRRADLGDKQAQAVQAVLKRRSA